MPRSRHQLQLPALPISFLELEGSTQHSVAISEEAESHIKAGSDAREGLNSIFRFGSSCAANHTETLIPSRTFSRFT